MKADLIPKTGFWSLSVRIYEQQTGQSAITWACLALGNLVFQVVFFHALVGVRAGEFGILNAALGIIGLLTVPLVAVHEAFHLYSLSPPEAGQRTPLDSLRAAEVTVTETAAWIWGGFCFLLLLLPLPLPYLPRFSLQLFTLMNVLLALAGVLSGTICRREGQTRLWTLLLLSAALTRVLLGAGLVSMEPWADAGLNVFLIAGFITLTPVLRSRDADFAARLKACQAVFDRDFLLFAAATLSVLLGLYLFTNADRIVTLSCVDVLSGQRVLMGTGSLIGFDYYQAAGLLGRSLLWGTQPLLWILYAQRSRLPRTNASSLTFFWIYLGVLMAGAFMLCCLTQPGVLHVLGGSLPVLGFFGPTFAAVMLPLGLLQGLGIFSLASKRYPECFVLGGCSVVYALVLAFCSRRPEFVLPYMFGGALVSVMAVLFVGVVRWGRKQP